jgi:hypothetical protein
MISLQDLGMVLMVILYLPFMIGVMHLQVWVWKRKARKAGYGNNFMQMAIDKWEEQQKEG